MRRLALALSALLIVAFGVTACGSSSTDNSSATNQTSSNTAASFTCPSDNTKSFATTRFVADLGIMFGTFHHWIYTPYKEGKFQQSGLKKVVTIGKAVAAAAIIAHFSSNAVDNVKASSKLCPLIGKPLAQANDLIQGLGGKLKSGDVSSVTSIQGIIGSVSGIMSKNGNPITESVQNP